MPPKKKSQKFTAKRKSAVRKNSLKRQQKTSHSDSRKHKAVKK